MSQQSLERFCEAFWPGPVHAGRAKGRAPRSPRWRARMSDRDVLRHFITNYNELDFFKLLYYNILSYSFY